MNKLLLLAMSVVLVFSFAGSVSAAAPHKSVKAKTQVSSHQGKQKVAKKAKQTKQGKKKQQSSTK
ncbi:hypothetical protein O9H85_18220 [Paenibacillus filicis]|uniref:Acid shock protein n=1 Tax=Paenibacillus gyeongsangnamensis TaxID=3388067 RepID=A0ABT4QC35_9BACL|nr:hypothetical protein [Paenibacillus filicis]MCZ8514327.1 hypothetical protein [Paenibacillus filicis]